MSEDSSNDNNDKDLREGRRSRMMGNTRASREHRHRKNMQKAQIRRLREQMISETDMLATMHIRRQTFFQLLNEIDNEDAANLGFDNAKRLSSILVVYQRQLAYCVNVNRRICESATSSDKDKQESTRIIADCALTWAKVQMEGPKVIREVYGPIADYTSVAGSPMPLPEDMQQQQQQQSEQFVVDNAGVAIPLKDKEEDT